ncbi:MAG: molybdenum ABC transporter ATP-binding protein [Pseudomonadota bacterium]
MLSVNLHHTFPNLTIEARFSVPTQPAGITALFGRSGAGKTSIINAVAGLLKPDLGEISLNDTVLTNSATDEHLPPSRRQIGYIFQEPRLFPHLSVQRNLKYGIGLGERQPSPFKFQAIVELLGLQSLLRRPPENLSGGEKQRVAIGRAILSNPTLILADEPLAALDEARRSELLPYFEQLRDELNIPMLYVSHSVAEVARLASDILVIEDGKITQQGSTVEVFNSPRTLSAMPKEFGALLDTVVVAHDETGLTKLDASGEELYVPKVERAIGASLRVRIPAQDVVIALSEPKDISALNVLSGKIRSLEEQGDGTVAVAISTRAGDVLAKVTQKSVQSLGLCPGISCFAITKTVAITQT